MFALVIVLIVVFLVLYALFRKEPADVQTLMDAYYNAAEAKAKAAIVSGEAKVAEAVDKAKRDLTVLP